VDETTDYGTPSVGDDGLNRNIAEEMTMKRDGEQKDSNTKPQKQKLVLRKGAIRSLDDRELAFVVGGAEPTDMGVPRDPR
jgi:hypothetical protein